MNLSLDQWRCLLTAALLLPWTAVLLKSQGYQKTLGAYSRARHTPANLSEEEAFEMAQAVSHMIDIAARYGLYRAKCLCRSLVLVRMLRNRGLTGDLVLGARIEDEKFGAHAWVNLDGQVVNDRPDVAGKFDPFT